MLLILLQTTKIVYCHLRSKAFAKKMLRWLLVQNPDHREIRAMKRCFLMNKSIDSFRIKQIELAMELVQDSV